jgi:hypothetical protein
MLQKNVTEGKDGPRTFFLLITGLNMRPNLFGLSQFLTLFTLFLGSIDPRKES